tara:strand:+ start:194 stop:529 length:336 start_codon:yes stop_codon:yes gene_type:complete
VPRVDRGWNRRLNAHDTPRKIPDFNPLKNPQRKKPDYKDPKMSRDYQASRHPSPDTIYYTILEHNSTTMDFIAIGGTWATTAEHAKLSFIRETGWQPSRNTCLFAQAPVCR